MGALGNGWLLRFQISRALALLPQTALGQGKVHRGVSH